MTSQARHSGAALAAGLALLSGAIEAARAEPIVFAPHRAVYEISLERTSPGSAVAGMDGRLVYELTGSACEGYTQNLRFVSRSTNQDGEVRASDLRSSTWEQVPALRFRFNSSTYQNDQLVDRSQGEAARKSVDGPITVTLEKPSPKSAVIGTGIYFPIQHAHALIAAARSGQPIYRSSFFDGSETGEKVYSTSAAIGARTRRGPVKSVAGLTDMDALGAVTSWPIAMSYFEPGTERRDAVPAFEMFYRLYENGVTGELVIDHGEFAFRARLSDLVFLAKSDCPAGQP